MEEQDKAYRRLLSFAVGFKDRFALLLVRSSHFDVQREWQERLADDLKNENIRMVHIRGDEMPEDLSSITSFIQNRIPSSDGSRWILSLSHFDYYMMPTFSTGLKGKDLLCENYESAPTPPSFVQRLNLERDAIVKTFPVPIIFWVSPAAIRQLAEYAPDFYDFRQFIIDLPQPDELRTFPNIPRASFIKMAKAEPHSKETLRQLNVELEEMQYRHRTSEESRRFIDILSELAASKGAEDQWESGLSLINDALNEARHMELPEEQARLQEQAAYFCDNMKLKEKALSRQEDAVALYRIVAQRDENIYLPGLVNALNRKAVLLAGMGKPIAAQKTFEEALAISRGLYKKEPGIHAPLLAEILNNFALLLTNLEQLKKAEVYYKEAVELYRNLPVKRYRILLALVLNNLGNLTATMMNSLDTALPLHQEALHLRRLYFAKDPERYRADLSQSLYNLSLLLGEMGNFQQAKLLFEEALETMSYLPDSGFEFLGCGDNQVQMHGFRIELEGIETLLRNHPLIYEAVVVVSEDKPCNRRLIAYIFQKGKSDLTPDEFRNYLRKKLPEYMIPSNFVTLEKLPLTANGKIDRNALRALPAPLQEKAFIAPRTDIEKALSKIWSEILGSERVSVNDNFFHFGGHSLKAILLTARIHKDFNVKIPLMDIFRYPTLAGLAKVVEGSYKEMNELPEKLPGN